MIATRLDIGDWIRILRSARTLEIADVAVATDIPVARLIDIEHARNAPPTTAEVLRLSLVFEVDNMEILHPDPQALAFFRSPRAQRLINTLRQRVRAGLKDQP